jgi:membrane carboxypeptidase/penicillin-binding protein
MSENDKRRAADDFDYAAAAAKEPTALQEDLADFIIEECGLTFASKAAEAAFRKGVQLATTLRMKHQASDRNQERLAALKAAREADEAPAEAPAKKAPAKKAPAKKAADAPAEEPTATPAKGGKGKRKPVTAGATGKAPF